MTSTGIDRETGQPLSGFDHVVQCADVIFTTRIGEMIMLRWFAAGLAELLGRRITASNLGLYRSLIALGLATWEPRLAVVAVRADGNTAAAVTLGELRFVIECQYRPGALQGDLTVEGGLRQVTFGTDKGGISIGQSAA